MSTYTRTILACDQCGAEYDAHSDSASLLRARAKEEGWHRGRWNITNQAGSVWDICPTCRANTQKTQTSVENVKE